MCSLFLLSHAKKPHGEKENIAVQSTKLPVQTISSENTYMKEYTYSVYSRVDSYEKKEISYGMVVFEPAPCN